MVAYLNVLAVLWRLKPDVLYVNQAGCLRAAAFWARCLRLPIVCQVQTLEDAEWISEQPQLHHRVLAFICNSGFIARETNVPRDRKCILYQGVSTARYANALSHASRPRMAPDGHRVVGILGRIAVSKGHYLLMEAAKSLVANNTVQKFVVIGDGLTAADTRQFMDAVREAGLSSFFEFRGYQSDIAAELSRLHILVIPSIAEPLGRVILDAAEFGVPCVVSDAGGLGELSERFEVGQRFRSGDSEDLVKQITHAFDSYDRFASACQSTAPAMLQRLSLGDYLAAIREILLKAAAGQPCCVEWFGS